MLRMKKGRKCRNELLVVEKQPESSTRVCFCRSAGLNKSMRRISEPRSSRARARLRIHPVTDQPADYSHSNQKKREINSKSTAT